MSKTQDLQHFLQFRSIRSPGESPQDRQAEAEKKERDKGEDIADVAAKNVKAVKDAKDASKITAAREAMAGAMEEKLREDKVLPKRTGEVAMMKEGGGGGAGGAGGAGGLAGGGTVAVASDPGVFTNTYGGDSKRRLGMAPTKRKKKKKKKKEKDKAITTGVTKADRFLRGEEVNQARKSVQQFAQWLVEEARTGLIQLDAKKENVNTGEVDESPRVASKPTSLGSQKVKNPQGRRGNFGPAPGQQGVSRPQFSHHFSKMKTITEVLNSNPSVLSLLKALDTDVPIGVD